jgi:uncharacterized protein (TIGR02453 family)
MAPAKAIFSKQTFRFFRDLGKNNRKTWMDKNRERYQTTLVQPLRRFLEELTPAILDLDDRFDTTGRTGANFSRINRDIRFAKDKTLYKTHMYLKFQQPVFGDRESGQLYVGLTANMVTVGFRLYAGPKRRESSFALIAEPRIASNPKWVAQQKKGLGRRYDSYWYSTVKGEWRKHQGWPVDPENWKKIQAWIVRKKMTPSAAVRSSFCKKVMNVFKDVYPLLKFTSLPDRDARPGAHQLS